MRTRTALAAFVVLGLVAGTAFAKKVKGPGQVHYVGIHPIGKVHGGGLCHIEVPHVHVYAPADPIQYRDYHGDHYFVGDPVAYGWDGDKHSYYGHHPIYVDAVIEGGAPGEPVYCYLDGPHFHTFEPPVLVAPDFQVSGGAYFYIGTPPPIYVEARPKLVAINAIYRPIEYVRPVVTVEPPSAWIGIRFAVPVAGAAVVVEDAPPPRARAGVEVHVPAGVEIDVRPPSVEIGIDVGIGVGVGGGGHVHGHGHGGHGGKVKIKGKGKGGGKAKGGVVLRNNRR
jgi:hypothetical protein